MTLGELLVYAERLGLVSFMFLVFVCFMKGWLYPGSAYRDMKDDRNKWQTSSLKQSKLNERLVGIMDEQDI